MIHKLSTILTGVPVHPHIKSLHGDSEVWMAIPHNLKIFFCALIACVHLYTAAVLQIYVPTIQVLVAFITFYKFVVSFI